MRTVTGSKGDRRLITLVIGAPSLLMSVVIGVSLFQRAQADSLSPPNGESLPAAPNDESISQQKASPRPGNETPAKDPFAPYDVGPPEALWTLDQLSPSERDALERERERNRVEPWENTGARFQTEARRRATKAAANAAALQLGLPGTDELARLGVEP